MTPRTKDKIMDVLKWLIPAATAIGVALGSWALAKTTEHGERLAAIETKVSVEQVHTESLLKEVRDDVKTILRAMPRP